MILDPTIRAMCDRCKVDSDEMEMTALAGGGYDERNVAGTLKRWGWRVEGDRTVCPECVEAEAEKTR